MNWHDHFLYDEATGNLIWKALPASMFTSEHQCNVRNSRCAGKVAGSSAITKHVHGIRVSVCRKRIGAHRIIWEMHNGPIPAGMLVDHEDCNPFNNLRSNLRLATKAQNAHNSRTYRSNTSGFKGVFWVTQAQKWAAAATRNGKKLHFGFFKSKEEAAAAYREKIIDIDGEFAKVA